MTTFILDEIPAYLESEEYEELAWRRGMTIPLVEFRPWLDPEFDPTNGVRHDDRRCDDSYALCTGDGFRWIPGVTPELRFR